MSDAEQHLDDVLEYDEPTLETVDPSARNYVVIVVGLSLLVWDIAFNYGVFNTVFFDRYFTVWVICTAVLLASVFLPHNQRPLGIGGAIALFVPTGWLILVALLPTDTTTLPRYGQAIITTLIVISVLSLPYIVYVLLGVTQPGDIDLPRRLTIGVVAALLVIGGIGFLVGRNHPHFLTCEQFRVSGNDVPALCRD